MANLFDDSKKKAVKKVKASDHEVVTAPALENDLTRMAVIDAKMAELKAEREALDSGVRSEAKEAFMEMYDSKNYFPGTLEVEAGKMRFQFITSDKYIKVDEDRAGELEKKYGDKVVDENTLYAFDGALLEKYKTEISDLLMNSKKISDSDKPNLISSSTTWNVKKGTVKNFKNDLLGLNTFKVAELVDDFKPIFSIKGIKKA